MKKNMMIMAAPVLLLLLLLFSGYELVETETAPQQHVKHEEGSSEQNWVRMESTTRTAGLQSHSGSTQAIVDYALSLLGAPYRYAGITPSGFDCSGFVTHVFDNYNIDIPHSSALQAGQGVPVAKVEAAPGDLVIFTGTDETVREPGHVGIVISAPGDTISFVHSSSNGGVKISKVQGTRYDTRFLEVRRVL